MRFENSKSLKSPQKPFRAVDHDRQFGSVSAVVPERRGLDLFGVGAVVPVVSDALGILPRRLNGSADVTSQEEE